MKLLVLFCIVAVAFVEGYEETIDYESQSDLCVDGKIQTADVPFTSKEDAQDWLNQNQMCYFAFVNEAEEYPDILEYIVDENTKVCWENDCEDPVDDVIVNDINTLRDYVDIHRQEYTITEWKKFSFKVEGKRFVKIEEGMSVPDFVNGVEIANEFEEEYTFNPNSGTLKKRSIVSTGQLALKLLQAGIVKYAHFARSIGQTFDIPERFKYTNQDGEKVYYIALNNTVVVAVLIILVGVTLITFCWSVKLMMSCLCKRKKVRQYQKVRVDNDTSDMEELIN